MDTQKFLEIAQALDRNDWMIRIQQLSERTSETTPIYVPLIGEFSAGKTTLINALTDSQCLETATIPTTATIYKIFFGNDENRAEVIDRTDGTSRSISKLAELKNESLKDAFVVNLYDKSNRVPQNIVLVDTPGLSSPDTKHKETLVNFLPYADAILLVTDINQQITRSLAEFTSTISETGKPIYLVVTKSDTKSPEDIANLRSVILNNGRISVKDVVFVSAQNNQLTELDELFKKIASEKSEILEISNQYQLNLLAQEMLSYIDTIQKESTNNKQLEDRIDEEYDELKQAERLIKQLEEQVKKGLETLNRDTLDSFATRVSKSLDRILSSKNLDYATTSNEAINVDASITFNEYKSKLKDLITNKASETRLDDLGINLETLTSADWEELSMNSFSMEIDLNAIGHQYDGAIRWGVIIAGAALAVTAVALTGGAVAAAGGTTTQTVGGAVTVGTALDVADTVSDVASIRKMSKLKRSLVIGHQIQQKSQEINQASGGNKGALSNLVSSQTEHFWGKPQRRRVIETYMEEQLLPEFKLALQDISGIILRGVNTHIMSASKNYLQSKKELVKRLNDESSENREKNIAFKKQLNNYRTELNNIKH